MPLPATQETQTLAKLTATHHRLADKACVKQFRPEEFFSGPLSASGMFIDRFGKVQRRFVADIDCTSTENGFILDESFLFDDGQSETRQWVISCRSETVYEGHCADVDGVALGRLQGPVLHWRYDFFLDVSGRRIKTRFQDMMVRQSEDVVLNRARVSKFGLLLGEVFISFRRRPADFAA